VGKTFKINGISFYGVQLCEPCASLQKRLAAKILPALLGKGGLRAQIRGNGLVALGDSIA
jgi:MOSC domain-containing protein YiiM